MFELHTSGEEYIPKTSESFVMMRKMIKFMDIFPKDKIKPGEKLSEKDYSRSANIALIIGIAVYLSSTLNLGLLFILTLFAMAHIFRYAQRGSRSINKSTLLKAKIARVMGYIYWILVGIGTIYLLSGLF